MAGYREGAKEGTALGRFVKAVAAGTAIAALVPLAILIAMLLSSPIEGWDDVRFLLIVAAVAVGIPFLCVLLTSIFVGLPTWFALRLIKRETPVTYICAGAAFGAFVMLLFFGMSLNWLVVVGAVAGGVTAYAWWRNRNEHNAI